MTACRQRSTFTRARSRAKNLVRTYTTRRLLASLLLFLFVQDIGFHLAEFRWMHPPQDAVAVQWSESDSRENHDPACPIPGHGTPFHHHHFPGLVTHASVALVSTSYSWLPTLPAMASVIPVAITTSVRGPPLV